MMNILLIDDDSNIVDGLEAIIKNNFSPESFSITKCIDGAEAVVQMSKHFYPIIVSDVKMPKLDGIALLRILRKENINSKVIVLSGYSDYRFVREALKLGAYDYLLKPVDIKTFCNVLNVIRNNEPVSQSNSSLIHLEKSIADESDNSTASNAEYFDLDAQEPFLTKEELRNALGKLANAVLNTDLNAFYELTEYIFSHISKKYIDNTDLKRVLTDYVYLLMNRSEKLLELVSSYKLTENDLTNQIKEQVLLSQLKKAFVNINELYIEQLRSVQNKKDRYLVKKATEYIEAHHNEQIMLSELASLFHMHPNYFSSLFKNETGTTVRDYILNIRIKKAKELMKDNNYKIIDIAIAVGYQDASHFNRAFKNITGMSPNRYRQLLEENETN